MENCEEQRRLLKLPDYVFPAVMLVFGRFYRTTEKPQKAGALQNELYLHMKIRIKESIRVEKNFRKC